MEEDSSIFASLSLFSKCKHANHLYSLGFIKPKPATIRLDLISLLELRWEFMRDTQEKKNEKRREEKRKRKKWERE